MSAALRTERVAGRRRRCDNCLGVIEPGERYARLSLPPHVDLNSGDRWWSIVVHADCGAAREQEKRS